MGDACDDDDDNDVAPRCLRDCDRSAATRLCMDSDGDTVNDGAEVIYKKNPMVGRTNKPDVDSRHPAEILQGLPPSTCR